MTLCRIGVGLLAGALVKWWCEYNRDHCYHGFRLGDKAVAAIGDAACYLFFSGYLQNTIGSAHLSLDTAYGM
jgi:hypothetical protein